MSHRSFAVTGFIYKNRPSGTNSHFRATAQNMKAFLLRLMWTEVTVNLPEQLQTESEASATESRPKGPNYTPETICSGLLQWVSSLRVRPSDSLRVRKMAGRLHCAHSGQGATWFRAEVIPYSPRQTPHRLTHRSGLQADRQSRAHLCDVHSYLSHTFC